MPGLAAHRSLFELWPERMWRDLPQRYRELLLEATDRGVAVSIENYISIHRMLKIIVFRWAPDNKVEFPFKDRDDDANYKLLAVRLKFAQPSGDWAKAC